MDVKGRLLVPPPEIGRDYPATRNVQIEGILESSIPPGAGRCATCQLKLTLDRHYSKRFTPIFLTANSPLLNVRDANLLNFRI